LESIYEDGHEGNAALNLAWIFSMQDEKQKALTWLERAVEKKAPGLISASLPIFFKSLQKEPRYQAILERIGVNVGA